MLFLIATVLTGCGGTKPVIKIGLIAPFDGLQRHIGYQRLYGVKLALKQANLAGGTAGYKIELVALNDYASADETIGQVQELILDSHVRGVIGQWDKNLFAVSLAMYEEHKMPVINPNQFNDFSHLPINFATDYITSAGSEPTTEAKQAYLATQYLLKAIEQTILEHDYPTRINITTTFSGLFNSIFSGRTCRNMGHMSYHRVGFMP